MLMDCLLSVHYPFQMIHLSIHKTPIIFVSLSLKCLVFSHTPNSSPLLLGRYFITVFIIQLCVTRSFHYLHLWQIVEHNDPLHEHICISQNLSVFSKMRYRTVISTTAFFTQYSSWYISTLSIPTMHR